MMEQENKRNPLIDYMKAIGIILMVMGHSGSPITLWIYLFHMSLFFIISGYCIKEYYSDSLSNIFIFLKKRIKSLYIPCVLFNAIICLLNNFFLEINLISGERFSTSDLQNELFKCLLFSGGQQLSGAMWFLRTLFLAELFYVIIEYILKKTRIARLDVITSILFVLLLCVVWLMPNELSGYQYLNVISVLPLIEIGHLFRKYNKKVSYPLFIYVFSGGITLLIFALLQVRIELSKNIVSNPIVFLVCSISGYCICNVLGQFIGKGPRMAKLFSYIGKHTLPIVMLHFISMKLVTSLQILIYEKPWSYLSSFPYYIKENGWWLVYTFVGVGVPLILYWGYSKIIFV